MINHHTNDNERQVWIAAITGIASKEFCTYANHEERNRINKLTAEYSADLADLMVEEYRKRNIK